MQQNNATTGLIVLSGVFAAAIVAAQVLANKIVNVSGLYAPAGWIAYAITFLVTDIVGEVYGKDVANRIVWMGFLVNLLFVILGLVAVYLPAAPFMSRQFLRDYARMVMGSWCITAAGLIAYICSQTHDVWLFHKLREKTEGRHLWLRNNVSTIISQLIDTTIFITFAFYIFPALFNPGMAIPPAAIPHVILGQWLLKVIVALCDTPFCYLGVKLLQRYETHRRENMNMPDIAPGPETRD